MASSTPPYITPSKTSTDTNDAIDKITGKVGETAHSLAEVGREATQNVGQVGDNIKHAVDKSVKDQPMATLAIAAALGFLLGAVWKS